MCASFPGASDQRTMTGRLGMHCLRFALDKPSLGTTAFSHVAYKYIARKASPHLDAYPTIILQCLFPPHTSDSSGYLNVATHCTINSMMTILTLIYPVVLLVWTHDDYPSPG